MVGVMLVQVPVVFQKSLLLEHFVNTGAECPAPSITVITLQYGPLQEGTIVTFTGRNLGVTFSDFTVNSITLISNSNSVQSTPISEGLYVW